MKLPTLWPPKDGRAFVALIASIGGAMALTLFAAWIVWILWRGGWPIDTSVARVEALAKALLGLLLTVAIILVSLGLAINRRSVKGSAFGATFEATGGDDAPTAAQTVADAAQETADQIKGE